MLSRLALPTASRSVLTWRCALSARYCSKGKIPDDDLKKEIEKMAESLKEELRNPSKSELKKEFEEKEKELPKNFMNFSKLRERQTHERSHIFNWRSTVVAMAMMGVTLSILFYMRAKKTEEKERQQRQLAGKAKIGGDWELLNVEGKPEGTKDLLGNWLLIYFGFTHCPDICPDEIEKMIKVVDLIKSDKTYSYIPIKPIFISVDPERDTIERVKKYCAEFSDKLQGYTGGKEQVDKVTKTFRVYYSQGPREKNAPDDYIVDHTVIMYLIDPEGKFHDYYGQNRKAEEIANIIKAKVVKYELQNKPSLLNSIFK